jgi:hypothetical protein
MAHAVVSAWNWKTGRWDYYRVANGGMGAYGDLPKLPTGGQSHALGETPEESAHALPPGATPAGSGDSPAGQVVQPRGQSKAGTVLWVGAAVLIAWLLWGGDDDEDDDARQAGS